MLNDISTTLDIIAHANHMAEFQLGTEIQACNISVLVKPLRSYAFSPASIRTTNNKAMPGRES